MLHVTMLQCYHVTMLQKDQTFVNRYDVPVFHTYHAMICPLFFLSSTSHIFLPISHTSFYLSPLSFIFSPSQSPLYTPLSTPLYTTPTQPCEPFFSAPTFSVSWRQRSNITWPYERLIPRPHLYSHTSVVGRLALYIWWTAVSITSWNCEVVECGWRKVSGWMERCEWRRGVWIDG